MSLGDRNPRKAMPRRPRLRFEYDAVTGRVQIRPEKTFYRVRDVAAMLDVCPRSVERWVDAGLLAAIKPVQARYVEHESLCALIARCYVPAFAVEDLPPGEKP
jgi:hypothetical protein